MPFCNEKEKNLAPPEKFSAVISEGSNSAPKIKDKRQKTKDKNPLYRYTVIPLYLFSVDWNSNK
jgi:hypothetical protein